MFGCKTIGRLTLESIEPSSKFQASKSINDFTSVGIQHKDVLLVSPHAKSITNEIIKAFTGNIEGKDFKILENQ